MKKTVTFQDLAKQPATPAVLAAMQSTETVVSQQFLDTVRTGRDVTAPASAAPAQFSWTDHYKLPADWATIYKPQIDAYNIFANSGVPLTNCILELLSRCPDPATGYRNPDANNLYDQINALKEADSQKEIHVNNLFRCIVTYKTAQDNASFEQFRQACRYIIIYTQHLKEAEAKKTLETPVVESAPVSNQPSAPYSWTKSQQLPDHWWQTYETQVKAYAYFLKKGATVTSSIVQVLATCPNATGDRQSAHATALIEQIQGLQIDNGQKEPPVNNLFRCIVNYNDGKDTHDVTFETYRQAIKYIIIQTEQRKEYDAAHSTTETLINRF